MKSEALYYKVENGELTCTLCPHRCRIEKGGRGFCNVRERENDKLYTLNDGKISSWAYDPIEKKPLSYFHPGSLIFSIGSFGCNLTCDFCQNVSLLSDKTPVLTLSDEDILFAAQDKGSIGIAYTYNEPTVSYEMTKRLSQKAKEKGLVNVLVTNGYIEQEPLKELLPYIHALNIDYKMGKGNYPLICSGREEAVLRTIETAVSSAHVEVTILLIPEVNTQEEVFREMMRNLSSISSRIPLHLSRYFPTYKRKTPPTSIETMKRLEKIAREYMDTVELGNVW